MKKLIFISIIVANSFSYAHSQVGINALNAQQGTLHIDGGADNNASGLPSASQAANDVFINANGLIALGHITPVKRLDISSKETGVTQPQTAIQIEDGNELEYKVLVSDVNGLGTWRFPGEMETVEGILPKVGISNTIENSLKTYFNINITLSVGTWVIFTNLVGETTATGNNYNNACWLNFIFCDSQTTASVSTDNITGRYTADYFYENTPTLFNGIHIIQNQSSGDKTYYLFANTSEAHNLPTATTFIKNFGSSDYPQNRVIALRIEQ
ncbi:hypothetical protein [Dysgonomonas macrotermitis]|uniref:Uncharacterized protein n=1 Tax=Dysgonomonas macrotermitis TaxID=1346286 RepID=A0A1M5EM43_9BACT|nr:hypothetical protein [Dysgonomonas macrotermitis]SHF80368.1 hypothetical protein SAMN05444362_11080 [Dysgonomonas macrotermitis]